MTVVDFGWYATVLKYQDFHEANKNTSKEWIFQVGPPGFCWLKSVFLFVFFPQNLVGAFWSVVDFLTSILSR